jgi:hypothetical protein
MSDTPENHSDDGQNPEGNPKGYKIGRGRPPKHTQWKKKQSGNRSGKRKPKPSYGDLCNRILTERVPVQENGKPVSLTRAKAWVKGLVYRGAILGNPVEEDILLMLEKPWDSAPRKYLEWRLVDSEDDIPPEPKAKRRA